MGVPRIAYLGLVSALRTLRSASGDLAEFKTTRAILSQKEDELLQLRSDFQSQVGANEKLQNEMLQLKSEKDELSKQTVVQKELYSERQRNKEMEKKVAELNNQIAYLKVGQADTHERLDDVIYENTSLRASLKSTKYDLEVVTQQSVTEKKNRVQLIETNAQQSSEIADLKMQLGMMRQGYVDC